MTTPQNTIDNELSALELAVHHGLPIADLVIEVGFGAGQFLIWRIAKNWWPQTRHVAIDPLPIYAGQAEMLKIFGVEWVAAIAAGPSDDTVFYATDPMGLTGFIIPERNQKPVEWLLTRFPTTTVDEQFCGHYQAGQSVWLRLDCSQGVETVLDGATQTLAVADAVSVVLNLNADPMGLGKLFIRLEQAGLRCYRIVDRYGDPQTDYGTSIITLTALFVRLERLPLGMTPLNAESIESTYHLLEKRRLYNTTILHALADAALKT